MGVFDKLKDRVAERAAKLVAKQSAGAAKAVARKSAEAAVDAAKGAGRALEEALFGEREAPAEPTDETGKPLDIKMEPPAGMMEAVKRAVAQKPWRSAGAAC